MRSTRVWTLLVVTCAAPAASAQAVPSGPHPRLFMTTADLATYTHNAATAGTSAAALVARCQDTLDSPADYHSRGGADGDNWPGSAVACAFAYRATGRAPFLAQALAFWHASLDDDQTVGDHLGCVAGVSTNWTSWAASGTGPTPPVLLTVTHDTGYPMRWYGPYVALTYDWLASDPGVPAALLGQTRTCLTNWVDWYAQHGYHHDEAGANYNAGFVIGNTLAAVAIGNDGGADGHLFTDVVNNVFHTLLEGQGLAGAGTAVGAPAGPMVGGDWLEGWQYGPLAVLEYATATQALLEAGAPRPAMNAWVDSLAVRYIHATVPTLDGEWVGGDFESSTSLYASPSGNVLDAVRVGPSSDTSAAWAAQQAQAQAIPRGAFVYNAIAERRVVAPQDYRAQSPAPPTWYLARGARAVYARSGWDAGAYWAVFASPPQAVSDHQHFAASNFVFSRGADHLIVDPSQYGAPDSLETNAVTADSPGVAGDYAPSQTPWSQAELPWARATDTHIVAARSDFARAFDFASMRSDIPYAHREWVMLPEGEVVAIDRVHTADASHVMYVSFRANTHGSLHLASDVAQGTVGASRVVIHAVARSGGTPVIQPPGGLGDSSSCAGSYPFGPCTDARLAVDLYVLHVPGPHASAVHVIDGLDATEPAAVVGSLNDAVNDPAGQNTGVLGAAVFRSAHQTYVVASSAVDGASGATMSYGVPGAGASRHVVFDAPEAADGSSHVAAVAMAGRCALTITAGAGGGIAGHPLMFGVASAADGCTVTASTDVAPASGADGGVTADASSGADGSTSADGSVRGDASAPSDGGSRAVHGGCSCAVAVGQRAGGSSAAAIALGLLGLARRRRRVGGDRR